MADYRDRMINHGDGVNIHEDLCRIADIIGGGADWENGVFGFIEHCDTLAPGSRIEYIGANKDFTPIAIDKSTGAYSLNSWESYPWLLENKPFMVKKDGTADYRLKEDDYTKKLDGTSSDVANASYTGAGAFSWARKIYKHEHMIGNDRYVYFCLKPRAGYTANGFIVGNSERDGAWIPMFYPVDYSGEYKSLATGYPDGNRTTDQQWSRISAIGTNARFLGGPLVETLVDLMIMFAKTTDLQGAYGNGNMSGYVNDSGQHYGMKENAVVNGGQFYGTSTGTALNKVFHSIVLITQNVYCRDPYELVVNGRIKVSKYFNYDLTGATYFDTGIDFPNDGSTPTSGWKYPSVYKSVPEWGGVPILPGSGSTSLGGCDGVYMNASQLTITAVSRRFAICIDGANGGPRARSWGNDAGASGWYDGAAPVLFPPAEA